LGFFFFFFFFFLSTFTRIETAWPEVAKVIDKCWYTEDWDVVGRDREHGRGLGEGGCPSSSYRATKKMLMLVVGDWLKA